jgi:hypothetical protein
MQLAQCPASFHFLIEFNLPLATIWESSPRDSGQVKLSITEQSCDESTEQSSAESIRGKRSDRKS